MTLRRLTFAALATACLLLLTGRGALAQSSTVSHFAPAGIEIDGDQLDDAAPATDWYPAFPPFRDPTRQDDDTLCSTSPAPKNDLTNTYVANDFDYLYVGMERLANRGNTSFFFSFDITGDGPSAGDFIFVFCFGSGDVVTDTYVLEWDAATAEFIRDSTPPTVEFAVNASRMLAPFGAQDRHGRPSTSLEAGQFGEARIRLADIEGFDVCAADDVLLVIQTKSSCSLRSECKDTSGDLSFSFTPLVADLAVSQPAGCAPELTATANAVSPRPDLVTYRWFLDGDEITDRDPTWATSDTIRIPLDAQCGPVEVRVIASDGTCEVEDAASQAVNRPPEAFISRADVDPCTGALTFAGDASTDCNGSALTYAWDFDSDGTVDSTADAGTHDYAGCGDRLVTLVVSDGECASAPAQLLLHVNAPPEAGLVVGPSAAHCLEIAWTTTGSDCDLTRPSSLYAESLASTTDFGDGSPATSDPSGVHRYAACGTYVVTTTTTDASGCSDTATREVTLGILAEVE